MHQMLFRSQVPDHLEEACDIALADGLLEQGDVLEPNTQLALYRRTGAYNIQPEGRPWPLVPNWSDAIVTITAKGRATLAEHRTLSQQPPGLAAQTLKPEWSKPKPPSQWAREFGVSYSTIIRRFREGTIRTKKLNQRSYCVAVADLPPAK